MADRRYGAPPPATDSEIVGADWYGADLSGQSHEHVALSEVEMVESSGRAALFSDCTFKDCRLGSSRFRDSAFLNCTFLDVRSDGDPDSA